MVANLLEITFYYLDNFVGGVAMTAVTNCVEQNVEKPNNDKNYAQNLRNTERSKIEAVGAKPFNPSSANAIQNEIKRANHAVLLEFDFE